MVTLNKNLRGQSLRVPRVKTFTLPPHPKHHACHHSLLTDQGRAEAKEARRHRDCTCGLAWKNVGGGGARLRHVPWQSGQTASALEETRRRRWGKHATPSSYRQPSGLVRSWPAAAPAAPRYFFPGGATFRMQEGCKHGVGRPRAAAGLVPQSTRCSWSLFLAVLMHVTHSRTLGQSVGPELSVTGFNRG